MANEMKVYVNDQQANEHINIIASLVGKHLSDLDISKELTRLGHKNLVSPYGSWSESDIKQIIETFKLGTSNSIQTTIASSPQAEVGKPSNHLSGKEVAIFLLIPILGIWYMATRDDSNSEAKQSPSVASLPQETQATTRAGLNSQGGKELAALMINLNKYLCAEVIEIRPLKVNRNVQEVTCIEYRGGTNKKTYLVDIEKGVAWVP